MLGDMPKAVRLGYFIPIPPNADFKTDDGQKPKGMYLHHSIRRSFLDYAGLEGRQPPGLEMSGDTRFLREMAEAFNLIADDIDRMRHSP
jgi:hypothetical protein